MGRLGGRRSRSLRPHPSPRHCTTATRHPADLDLLPPAWAAWAGPCGGGAPHRSSQMRSEVSSRPVPFPTGSIRALRPRAAKAPSTWAGSAPAAWSSAAASNRRSVMGPGGAAAAYVKNRGARCAAVAASVLVEPPPTTPLGLPLGRSGRGHPFADPLWTLPWLASLLKGSWLSVAAAPAGSQGSTLR